MRLSETEYQSLVKAVPSALRSLTQWIGWQRVKDDKGAWTKQPRNPNGPGNASTTDPATWATFDKALDQAQRRNLSGVGFVFTAKAGIVGVDLDHCRNEDTGTLTTWAKEIIAELDSYTELSPSNTGVHILIAGKLPPEGRRKGHVEVYEWGRYFTFTGAHLEGTPDQVEPRQAPLEALHTRLFGKTEQKPAHNTLQGATGG